MKRALYFLIIFFFAVTLTAQNKTEEKSNFKISFSERLRIETYDNVTDLNNLGTANQSYTRAKSTLGLLWNISPDVSFTAKISNEFRKYLAPKKNPFHWNEVFFENFYLKANNILSGTITIGRQEMVLGEGFIIKEGTPSDVSRDYYFNALRYDWKIDKANTITFFAVYQPKEDNLLPILNGMDIDASAQGENSYIINDQTETGAGAYYSGDLGKVNLQGYYVWKKIDFNGKKLVPESSIHTIGSRVKNPFSDQISLAAEAAYQFGTCGDFNRSAYAGYAYIDFKTNFEPAFLPKLFTLGTIYLSGDDTATPDNEGWDAVFSRWPKWSVSYVSMLNKESGRASNWTNFISLYVKLEFNVAKDVDFIFQNHLWLAPQKSLKTAMLSGDGTSRGNYTAAIINYKFNGNMSGHVLWEHLEPGDYYFTGHDNYNYVRMELIFNL